MPLPKSKNSQPIWATPIMRKDGADSLKGYLLTREVDPMIDFFNQNPDLVPAPMGILEPTGTFIISSYGLKWCMGGFEVMG